MTASIELSMIGTASREPKILGAGFGVEEIKTDSQQNAGEPPRSSSAQAEARTRFEAIITEQLDGLFRSALRLTRNRLSAEDLVQETMLKAWRSFHTFHLGTNVRAWLHRILINTFFSVYRKRRHEPEMVNDDIGDFSLYDKVRGGGLMSGVENPEIRVLDTIMDAEVRDSLDALPAQFRAVVVLSDLQGFSYKEIAGTLGIPEGTVMSRLSRGRHLLQHGLWHYAQERRYVKRDLESEA